MGKNSPSLPGRQIRTAPYLVFGLGIAVTLVAWRIAYKVTEENDQLRFSNSVIRTRDAIVTRIQRNADVVRGAAAMVSTFQSIDRKSFHHYYRTLALRKALEGVQGLGFTYHLRPGEREALVDKMRRDGRPTFSVHPPAKDEHAILYIEPETRRNQEAIGLNMHAYSPERRAAMDLARDSGDGVLSGKVKLVQEIQGTVQPGFLIYYPVFRGDPPLTREDRRRQLLGFAYSPFRAYDMLNAVLKSEQGLDVAVEVYDDGIQDAEHLLFSDVPRTHPPRHRELVEEHLGRVWLLRFVPLPNFEQGSGQRLVIWIPFVGTLVSLLLASLSAMQARAQRDLEAKAEELHRREYQQRLLAQAGAILGASLDVEQTLASVANLAVPSFADWCAVDIVDENGEVRRLAVAHVDPEKVRWAQEIQEKYPPDPDALTGTPSVLRTGKPELYSHIPRKLLEEAAKTEELKEIIEQLALESAIIVPMTARGKTLGTISFVWAESGFHYDEEDMRLASEIGVRAGLALDNARLFRDSQDLNENLEHLVRDRTTELEASNRELEAFCYSVSHDLRAPLRSVDGFSKALIEDYENKIDEQGISYLHRVRAAARRMDELITALLNLSRLTRAEIFRQDLDLSELSHEAIQDLASEGERRPEFVVQEGMRVNGDPRMIRIVMDNLLANAVKFSARSESPRIEVGQQDGAVYVRDNGVGFNPEYSGKLFGAFERLHSATDFPGTGIGLATVQRIVARHGGRVWAEGEEGKGATFWFSLTASAKEA